MRYLVVTRYQYVKLQSVQNKQTQVCTMDLDSFNVGVACMDHKLWMSHKNIVEEYSFETGRKLCELKLHDRFMENIVRIVSTGDLYCDMVFHTAHAVCFSHDHRFLYIGTAAGHLFQWSVVRSECVKHIQVTDHQHGINCMCSSLDNQYLFMYMDIGILMRLNLSSWEKTVMVSTCDTSHVSSMCVIDDLLYTAHVNHVICQWSVITGQCLQTWTMKTEQIQPYQQDLMILTHNHQLQQRCSKTLELKTSLNIPPFQSTSTPISYVADHDDIFVFRQLSPEIQHYSFLTHQWQTWPIPVPFNNVFYLPTRRALGLVKQRYTIEWCLKCHHIIQCLPCEWSTASILQYMHHERTCRRTPWPELWLQLISRHEASSIPYGKTDPHLQRILAMPLKPIFCSEMIQLILSFVF